jgi:hypothetical protein
MSEENDYHGAERRWQPPPSKIPKFIREYVALWVLGVVGMAVWFGGMAYVDTRHIQRAEFMEYAKNRSDEFKQYIYTASETRLLDKIDNADAEVSRLQLYNRLGSQTNQPARDQVIEQTNKRKGSWERELKSLQQNKNNSAP